MALFHGEWLVDQAFACGHVPQHHAAATDAPYPAAMVLPSGLKATLATCALLHGEWLVDQAFACGHVPQHHAAAAARGRCVSGRDGLAVGAEGHAPNLALFHGEWLVDQAFACGHVPQHHATAADARIRPRWSCRRG